MRPESGFRIAPKWRKIGKLTMRSQFANMTSSSNSFDVFWFLLSSLFTGPTLMSISSLVYKGFTRNPKIRNTPVWVLLNIWRLGRVRDIKVWMNVSNKMLLYAAKCQGCSFCCFWVIKGKPTEGTVGRGGGGGGG